MKGSNGQPLGGAEFALYQGVNGQPSSTPVDPGLIATDETGEAVITGFAAGTYFLQMTKGPEGYTLLAQNIRVNVRADGTIVFPNRPPTPQATFDDNGQGKYTVTITGTEAAKLPLLSGGVAAGAPIGLQPTTPPSTWLPTKEKKSGTSPRMMNEGNSSNPSGNDSFTANRSAASLESLRLCARA